MICLNRQEETFFTRDTATIDRIKADILYRTEISDADAERDENDNAIYLVDEDEIGDTSIRVTGDGDESSDETEEDGPSGSTSPETILMHAYIRNPKLFDRSGEIRRSAARANLKAQTGESTQRAGFVRLASDAGLQAG